MRTTPSIVAPGHPDFLVLDEIRKDVVTRVGGIETINQIFPSLIRDAIDFVLDPVRTGRTKLSQLDKVEKTFIGLKIEHFVIDMLDAPKGLRDLVLSGLDVDIKNTVRDTWMIPKESYSVAGPCLVIASEEETQRCWLGVLIARDSYLTRPNRDLKRSVSSKAFENILWLLDGENYPQSKWADLDMDRFRELRKIRGGTNRACKFLKENLRTPIHRDVLLSLLFDQLDPMKRIRGNRGARDRLRKEGIAVLTGAYDNNVLGDLGIPRIERDQTFAVNAQTDAEAALLRSLDKIG